MTVDTERLRQLATDATPGPWASERESVVTAPRDPEHAMIVCGGDDDPHLSAADQEIRRRFAVPHTSPTAQLPLL